MRDLDGLIVRPPLPPLTDELNIYIWYGQSNSSGNSTTQFVNASDPTMGAAMVYGRDGRSTRDGTSLVWCDLTYPPAVLDFSGLASSQLQEPCRAYAREMTFYEAGRILNERQIAFDGKRHRMAFACFGHTNYTQAQLLKGENAYTNLGNGVTQMVAAAVALGLTPKIRAVVYTQGEAEFAASGSGWKANTGTLQSNLNADLKAITGQSEKVRLVISQQSNFASNASSAGGILYPVLDQLQAHIDYPDDVVLFGPMYAAENISAANLHYMGYMSRRYGAGIGNCLATLFVDGGVWNPIRPRQISRDGNVVDIELWVPSGPLVIDTTYATALADGNYGLDFRQTGGTTTLPNGSVSLLNPTTLRCTLSGVPDGTNPRIRAGKNFGAGAVVSGFRTGARTNIRDSAGATPMSCNWCVHFDEAIP